MVDLFFIFDQSSKRIEDLKKELDRFGRQLIAIICARWVQESSPESAEPIRGELATGSPDIAQSVSFPKKDTPEYEKMLDEFCIPRRMAGYISFHWPTITEYATQLLSSGGTLPDCFAGQQLHPDPRCRLLPKAGNPIDEVLQSVRQELNKRIQ